MKTILIVTMYSSGRITANMHILLNINVSEYLVKDSNAKCKRDIENT